MQQIYGFCCNTPATKIQLGVSQALVAGASDTRRDLAFDDLPFPKQLRSVSTVLSQDEVNPPD
jgi:hypothetical protein